jgi:hypothetical protein
MGTPHGTPHGVCSKLSWWAVADAGYAVDVRAARTAGCCFQSSEVQWKHDHGAVLLCSVLWPIGDKQQPVVRLALFMLVRYAIPAALVCCVVLQA